MIEIVDSIPERRTSVVGDVKEFLNTGSAIVSKRKFPVSFTMRDGRLFMIRK